MGRLYTCKACCLAKLSAACPLHSTDGVEVSPPGGVLVRRAPGDAACDFGQLIPLATAWSAAAAAASKARRRSTLQPGGAPVGQQQQQQQLVIHPESLAWACSLPDPAAALDCIQRAALLAKAAGPGGTLVGQPGECFATTLPCGFRWEAGLPLPADGSGCAAPSSPLKAVQLKQTPVLPPHSTCSLKLVLLSTWGCPHYIGLSGLEVRDAVRGPLHARPDQVWAAPASVAALPGMAADVRTPDKLVDGDCRWAHVLCGWQGAVLRQQRRAGVNVFPCAGSCTLHRLLPIARLRVWASAAANVSPDTDSDSLKCSGAPQHSWLAPLDVQEGNVVRITLDAPVLLSSIR